MHIGFASFFHEIIAVKKPLKEASGFKEFIIKPSLIKDLKFAKASINSPYGTIKSEWISKSKVFTVNVEIPANTRAQVILPTNNFKNISIANEEENFLSNHLKEKKENSTILSLGSGEFTITVKKSGAPESIIKN